MRLAEKSNSTRRRIGPISGPSPIDGMMVRFDGETPNAQPSNSERERALGPREMVRFEREASNAQRSNNELKRVIAQTKMVPWGGFEPPTRGFSIRCSTN